MKPLLVSVRTNNLHYESQNHVLVMHIISHFFPIFLKISRSSDDEKCKGGQEEGKVEVDEVVEVDEER